jgi:hypothetical protein
MSKRKNIDPMGNAVDLLNDDYCYFKDTSIDFLEDVTDHFGLNKSN